MNQDPIGLLGGSNLYRFAPNAQGWTAPSGFIAMALFFLPEIGAVLTAAGQVALTAIGNGAVLSLGGDTNYAGSVMIDGLPNREAALAWEKAQVRAYRAANNGARPPKQYRP